MAKNKTTLNENFIQQLSKMTKEEMYDYIKKNGKPPKLIKLYHIMSTKVSKN